MHCIFKVRENKSHVQGEKGCGSLGREGLLKVNKRFTVFRKYRHRYRRQYIKYSDKILDVGEWGPSEWARCWLRCQMLRRR